MSAEKELLELRAEMRVAEHCLAVVIASHPEPHRLHGTWQERLPELLAQAEAEGMADSSIQGPALRGAILRWNEALAAPQG